MTEVVGKEFGLSCEERMRGCCGGRNKNVALDRTIYFRNTRI